MKKIIITILLALTISFNKGLFVNAADKLPAQIELNETLDDIDELTTELKSLLREAEDVIARVSVDKGVSVDKLPLGRKYAPKELLEGLEELIKDAKELLEKEDKTAEEIRQMIMLIEDSIYVISENTIVGTNEYNYRRNVLIIGGALLVLTIIGGITNLVLYSKQKKISK